MANSSGSPDSKGNCRAMRAKKLSMVLAEVAKVIYDVSRSAQQVSASRSGCAVASASCRRLSVSVAASAMRRRSSSRNSPADLRVKVSAAMRSIATPASSSRRIIRVVSAKVFPLPALATSIWFVKGVFGVLTLLGLSTVRWFLGRRSRLVRHGQRWVRLGLPSWRG